MNDDGLSSQLGVLIAHPPSFQARALWRGRWADAEPCVDNTYTSVGHARKTDRAVT